MIYIILITTNIFSFVIGVWMGVKRMERMCKKYAQEATTSQSLALSVIKKYNAIQDYINKEMGDNNV